ncbi:MAG: D-alanyl-D-alanine carboxypeptidase [Oscillospiraceae bacterium]|jgi:D-alanyl-D-alanine carboxypeptidase (penicillin-binding protein 5/6)|nr:D-alanyl-D-alanine carboxypeptidase [Oscillospiraceae bacterium]
MRVLKVIFTVMIAGILSFGVYCIRRSAQSVPVNFEAEVTAVPETTQTEPPNPYHEKSAELMPLDALASDCALLVNMETHEVIGEKNAHAIIEPASLTKIMTMIAAIENSHDLNAEYTVPSDEMFEPLWELDASMAGFHGGDTVTVMDMLYGAALPSGADATACLGAALFGTEEKLVAAMNKKAAELGLQETTNFANTSGLHDPEHYSTVADIAVIFEYALENSVFRRLMETNYYKTEPTASHPEGTEMQSTFLKYIKGDELKTGTILGGKTGFTDNAGLCLASFAEIGDTKYMLITAGAAPEENKRPNIDDAVSCYSLVEMWMM